MNEMPDAPWRKWHAPLVLLVNGEHLSLRARIAAEIAPQEVMSDCARKLIDAIAPLPDFVPPISEKIAIELPACNEHLSSVARMSNWLRLHLASDLSAAILHGSLGTNEAVNYSDFDALVIIKREVFKDWRRLTHVSRKLFEARRFMYQQDPLQHHGWFVLPEHALSSWPEEYLPVSVLRKSSQMLGTGRQRLEFTPCAMPICADSQFLALSRALNDELNSNRYLTSIYRFKSMLSKALLLPALYVQARDGRGIFKRDSYSIAKRDFSSERWMAMNIVSQIRSDWPAVESAFPHALSLRPGLSGDLIRKYRSGPVPERLKNQLGGRGKTMLIELLGAMEARLYRQKQAI